LFAVKVVLNRNHPSAGLPGLRPSVPAGKIAAPVIVAASFGTENAGVLTSVALVPAFEAAASASCTEPGNAVVAALIAIRGVLVPVATVIGRVPVTELTMVAAPSSLVLSAALIEPAVAFVAALIVRFGAAPPLDTRGRLAVTPVTDPPPPPPAETQAVFPGLRTSRVGPAVSNQRVPAWNNGGAAAPVKTGKVTVPSAFSDRFA
jgi:hypothetical protein